MSITGALSSALSGLTAAARGAEVVSSNIANARTEGYGRREVQLAARAIGSTGQGVRVDAVIRRVDPALIGERRTSSASHAGVSARTAFHRGLEAAIGTPDSADSLSRRITALDSALVAAASRPDSEARLSQIHDAAQGLAAQIRRASDEVKAARTAADGAIAADVSALNAGLQRVAELNAMIQAAYGGGHDNSALLDQRQAIIDQIAAIVPMREVPRESGAIALFTTGGAILLDGTAGEVGFTPTGTVQAGMSLGAPLSGLTLNGRPLSISASFNAIGGGRLAANLAIRDDEGPAAQVRLDALARDLIDRFADPALDPSLAPGDPGLFTDAGAAFAPANETGLAGRIAVNARVDPRQGGALWRLRDGIGATAPGPPGNSALLGALQSRLTEARPPQSGGFMAGDRSFHSLGADLVSGVAANRLSSEAEETYAAARLDSLVTREREGGVDTDQEMQTLLLIEQSYAANARVISAVDEMIQQLLGI